VKFWDSSALLPLCISEPRSATIRHIAQQDEAMAVWWATVLECQSAVARLRREGSLSAGDEDQVREDLVELQQAWTEMEPSDEIRSLAGQLLLRHPLRAADSLQLAAALLWAGRSPGGMEFVCLDARLREAARGEGFKVAPES
jgi:predicted nucleic acid-binding protein